MAEAETCVKDSIVETVRKLLPVKHILKEYLGGNYEDEDLDEDVTSVMSTTTKNNLRKLVKAEIENTLKESVVEERIPEPILEESPLENNYLPHPENQPKILDKKEEAIQEIVDNSTINDEIKNKETDEPEDQVKEANAELYDLPDENAEIQVNANNNDVITMDEAQIAELEQFQEQLDSDAKDDQTSIVVEDRKEPEPEIKMVIIQPTEKEKEKKQTATKKIVEEKESIKEKTSAKSNRDEFEPKPSADDDDDNFSFFDDATEE
jgi:hypothetical protein